MISVSGLSKKFDQLQVLSDLDLEVEDHELVCILGPSGSGKSTLLNIIAGLQDAHSGRVERGASRIGYLFQEPRLLPWRTAERNVDFALESCGVAPGRRAELKDRYFGLVGLEGFRGYYPHQLSGGMRQREIGRADV